MTLGHLDKKNQKQHKTEHFSWVFVFQKYFSENKHRHQRQHRRNKAQQDVGKSDFSLELIFLHRKKTKKNILDMVLQKKTTETLMEISNEQLGFE